MKYIRTKDGRIINLNHKSLKGLVFETWVGNHILVDGKGSFVISEADSIEELCDGLIVEEKETPSNWFVMGIDEFIDMSLLEKNEREKNWNFHPFIKTDKGLIYVAKMNEKGELELL